MGQSELPGNLFFGDDSGMVHVTDEECVLLFSFRAFHGAINNLKVATDDADGDAGLAPPPPPPGTAAGPFLVVLGDAGRRSSAGHSGSGGGQEEVELWAVKIFRVDEILKGGFGDTIPPTLRELPLPLPHTLRPSPSSSTTTVPR
jgi:hypothetical protein